MTPALVALPYGDGEGSSWLAAAVVATAVLAPVVLGLLWRRADRVPGGGKRSFEWVVPSAGGAIAGFALAVLLGADAAAPAAAGAGIGVAACALWGSRSRHGSTPKP